MLNWIISITKHILKLFNGVEMKLLLLDSNIWNYLTVCKQINTGYDWKQSDVEAPALEI